VELLYVQESSCPECRELEIIGSEGGCQLFLGKNRSEIVWIDAGIILISLFRVDVPASS
jgi:hypothetical protein